MLHLQWSGGFHAGPGNCQWELVIIMQCLSVQAMCTRDYVYATDHCE